MVFSRLFRRGTPCRPREQGHNLKSGFFTVNFPHSAGVLVASERAANLLAVSSWKVALREDVIEGHMNVLEEGLDLPVVVDEPDEKVEGPLPARAFLRGAEVVRSWPRDTPLHRKQFCIPTASQEEMLRNR